jgi:hypothetical protein
MWKRGAGDSWALDGSLMAGIWSENEVSCRHCASSHRLVSRNKAAGLEFDLALERELGGQQETEVLV